MIKQLLAAAIILLIGLSLGFSESDLLLDFDELVMRSTVKIYSGNNSGTGFILLAPVTGETNRASFVLVTAAHVLAGMPSSNVVISLRVNDKDTFKKLTHEIPIRVGGTNLWTTHPTADVAAMRLSLPRVSDFSHLSIEILRDDKFLVDFRIHPGDEVRVLGFPYGYEANNAGFPVLRSGRIASYPLTPTTNNPTLMIDFRVFRGNSGGPVYMSERRSLIKGALETVSIRGIIGLVSKEAKISESVVSLNEQSVRSYDLGLGIVVPSRFILETIELLPAYTP